METNAAVKTTTNISAKPKACRRRNTGTSAVPQPEPGAVILNAGNCVATGAISRNELNS